MVNDTFFDKTQSLLTGTFEGIIAKVVAAILVLLIGLVIGKIIGRMVQKALHEIELNKLIKKTGLKFKVEEIIGAVVSYVIYLITIIFALNTVGITPIVLYILLGAIVIFMILSLLLATKDFVPNVVAGLFILRKGNIEKGDKIKSDSVEGVVQELGLLETKIKTKKGDIIFIPNSKLVNEKLVKKH